MTKKENKVEEIVNSFLEMLGVSAKATASTVDGVIKIEIDGADSSLLIGFHGDNLRALKHLLAIVLRKEIDHDTIISVDVSGYLAKKEDKIKEIAQRGIESYEKTNKPTPLPVMNPFERRIAHSYLSDKGYTSASAGEGYERHIVIGG